MAAAQILPPFHPSASAHPASIRPCEKLARNSLSIAATTQGVRRSSMPSQSGQIVLVTGGHAAAHRMVDGGSASPPPTRSRRRVAQGLQQREAGEKCGGEGGIRTHEALPLTAFPVPRPRPD